MRGCGLLSTVLMGVAILTCIPLTYLIWIDMASFMDHAVHHGSWVQLTFMMSQAWLWVMAPNWPIKNTVGDSRPPKRIHNRLRLTKLAMASQRCQLVKKDAWGMSIDESGFSQSRFLLTEVTDVTEVTEVDEPFGCFNAGMEHAGTCRNCVWRLSDWTTWFSWLSIAVRKFPSWFFESSWSQIYQADKGRENGCLVQKTEWEVVCSYHSSEKMQGWHRVVWRKRASGCVQDWDRFGQARAEYACGVLPPENAQQFMYQYLIMQNNDEYCACINVCPYRYL